EGHAQAGLPALEQVVVARVALLGAAEARVLAHGPEAAAVHGGLHAAGEGVLPGEPQPPQQLVGVLRALLRRVDRRQGDAARGGEGLLALSGPLQRLGPGGLIPALVLTLPVAHDAGGHTKAGCPTATAS